MLQILHSLKCKYNWISCILFASNLRALIFYSSQDSLHESISEIWRPLVPHTGEFYPVWLGTRLIQISGGWVARSHMRCSLTFWFSMITFWAPKPPASPKTPGKKLLGQLEPVLDNYIMKVVITPCLHLCFVINSPLSFSFICLTFLLVSMISLGISPNDEKLLNCGTKQVSHCETKGEAGPALSPQTDKTLFFTTPRGSKGAIL